MSKKNNIFFIEDDLGVYKRYFFVEDESINFFSTSLNNLNEIDTTQIPKKREHNIVIFNAKLFNDGIKNELIDFFTHKGFDFTLPYLVVLTSNNEQQGTNDQLINYDDYVYYLPIENEDERLYNANFMMFITVVFDKLLSDERLNSFIIDSFHNLADSHIVLQQKREIEKLNKELEMLSKIDPLTKLYNRRAFFEAFEDEIKKTAVITCLLIDIDMFKVINDTYGHQAGDIVLKTLGKVILSDKIFRKVDIFGRYGGEEFIIILPGLHENEAAQYAQKLCGYFKKVTYRVANEQSFNATLSIGVSELRQSDNLVEKVINRADQALYQAKHEGRDRVVVYKRSK